MLKALIKKELSQLGSFYFFDSRKGRRRSRGAAAAYVLLFVFLFFTMAAMFLGLAHLLAEQLIPAELDWLYFAMMGLTAVMFGVIGSVFTTHTILYKAKDNETLLAMPIPPSKILLSRMLIVYGSSLLLVMAVWLPAMLCYAAEGASGWLPVILQILLMIMLAALVTVLNCALGWLVALISRRLRSKTAATVILSLVFLGAYYFFYFKIRDVLAYIISSLDKFEAAFRGWGWPLSQLGLGASGEVLPAIIFTLMMAGLFAIAYAVLSATLLRILTASNAGRKAVYREKRAAQSSVERALLGKEFRRLTGSATYLLNCGLGLLIMLAGAVLLIIKAETVRSQFPAILESIGLGGALTIIIPAAICFICSMDLFTTSTVSLEGKSIWILQSMPVEASKVLRAKVDMHLILNLLPSWVLFAAAAIVFRLPAADAVSGAALVFAFNLFIAEFGLMMNLLKPNLEWTNEAVPIKQGMPVMLTLFIGWITAGLSFGIGLALNAFLPAFAAVLIFAALFLVSGVVIGNWVAKRGAEIFSNL